jgi:F-type H+-transporting ATPase subunit gamma
MSELIQMRQRIKAIETIKKITHAMRLISMSSHVHLKNKNDIMTEYVAAIDTLFFTVQQLVPEWNNKLIDAAHNSTHPHLIIIVGSQKGLCGNFNNFLVKTCQNSTDFSNAHALHTIVIGKKAIELMPSTALPTIIQNYPFFSVRNLPTLAHSLLTTITQAQHPYSSVTLWSNHIKHFFIQRPQATTLIPLQAPHKTLVTNTDEDYIWQHDRSELTDTLFHQYLEAHIYQILLQSLMAEHAARFISMDSSTRNAKNLLEESKLAYNKARQAKITKELTELSGSF